MQIPPIFSAKQIDGKRAYESARVGEKLNSGGTLIALRRTNSGNFSIKNALSVDEVIEKINSTEI